MIAVRRRWRAQLVGEVRQDADNFSAFVTFKFSYAIVGFHYFGRLDEYGFTTGRLVVYNTVVFSVSVAGATGMTRRPSRMVGVTSLSTTPSDWAFR